MDISAKTVSILRGLFGVDDSGQIFLRVVKGQPTSELKNAVSSQSNRSLETLLSNSVVLDADGNPAIRLAAVSFGETVENADKRRRQKMASDAAARKAAQAAESNG